jgi:hypothetical protein
VKDRKKIVEIVVKESADISSIVKNDDRTFSLIDSQGELVEHEQSESVGYLKSSGKAKIIRSIVRKDDDRPGDNPWKKYDKIGFIDTNSMIENGWKIYVSSPSLLLWQNEDRRLANIHHVDFLAGLCSNQVNPERIGWTDFIQRLQASQVLTASDKVLIIVDSEKGLISSINERTEPVFEQFMLPDGFTLAYATSDAGSESWINKEMKRRDRVASLALTEVLQNKKLLTLLDKSGSLYIKNSIEQQSQNA